MSEFEDPQLPAVWFNMLSQINSIFGRLVYVASLRNQNTGKYEHFELAQSFGEQEAHDAVRESHAQVFAAWLELSVQKRHPDLDRYLSTAASDVREVIHKWLGPSPDLTLIPADALEPERKLFVSEVRLLFELLRRQHDIP